LSSYSRTKNGSALFREESPKTVDNRLTCMMEKLSVHGTAELVRFAAKHKLLS
jgi:DNA-binding NarL/FixJ family response regulator